MPGASTGISGIAHRRPAIDELEHAPPGSERGAKLARCGGQRRHGVERRQREQRERRDEHPVQRGLVVCSDGECQHTDRRQPRDENGQRIGDAGDERIAATQANELAVRVADARERVLLPAEGDELRRTAQELDELGRELPARRRLSRSQVPCEASGEERNHEPREREPDGEHDRRRR